MSGQDLEQRLEKRFEDEIEQMGYRLKYVEWAREGKEYYLRFFIDHSDGINIDDCEKVSRYIDPILDQEFDIRNGGYILEVSSPGLEAPLRKERDYKEALGSYIKVGLYEKQSGSKEFSGILSDYDDDTVVLDVDGSTVTLQRKKISSIHHAVQF